MKHPHLSVFIRVLIFFIFQLSVFNFLSCSKKTAAESSDSEAEEFLAQLKRLEAIENAKNQAVAEYVASLSDEVKVSQLFLVNIEGNQQYHAVEKTGSLYGKKGEGNPLVPGGVLLFSYNVSKDPLETYGFIKSIRDFYIENSNVPPYVAVDQEGGDVNRLRSLTSPLWAQKKIAESFSPEKAAALYSAQARQMKNLGFHLNLAPVIEVENQSNKDFLDTRTFGTLEKTLLYGKVAVESYENNGIGVVLKHFPGNSSVDPHVGLPKITFSESEWDSYFKPFEELLPLSSAVLMSHAIMKPEKDEHIEEFEMPACFSHHWIMEVARYWCNFSGLVFSDDIFMGALAKNGYPPETAVVKAIEAGVDVIMLSEKRFGNVAKILLEKSKEDQALSDRITNAAQNVTRYKIRAGILELIENPPEVSEGEDAIPSFTVRVKQDYPEFDLNRFNEDYKDGMKAYED